MNTQEAKERGRLRRRSRVRKKCFGLPERPRLTVFRSLNHIYGQIIDDVSGRTLVAASSLSRELRDGLPAGGRGKDAAKLVGKLLGEKAKAADITRVAFDRNGYRFHGRVKELADGAREAGLKF
jgi:large subunit ribosomal protein L18